MNLLYSLALLFSVMPATAPLCSSLRVYPTSMFWCNILFLMNALFFFFMQWNNFFLQAAEQEDNATKPLLSKNEDHEKYRKIFKERTTSYGNYLKILSVVQVVIILLGKVYIDAGEYLACTAGGFQWISTSIGGELFVAGIMVTIMMQSVMIEKFLYRIPNKYGMFDSIKIKPVTERLADALHGKLVTSVN